ncbi:uncharacterized protein LOC132716894 [Ruditapes philippinarum]|uniref:uncharacterized protein LOC132716894 n=1 Tax=Ruditapes philippinarum TaxID=129788 RepID=UPI00295B5D81|nr:uncharacterized protein LOC132716894 [Ruditapes philippinarum]
MHQQNHPSLNMHGQIIPEVEHHKHLQMTARSWHEHIKYIVNKAWKRVHIMRRLKFTLDRKSLEVIYTSFIRPILEYADVIWNNCSMAEKDMFDKFQNECARIVSGATKLVSLDKIQQEVNWSSLKERRRVQRLIMFYKMINGLAPEYLTNLVPPNIGSSSSYNLRNPDQLRPVHSRTNQYYKSFLPTTVRDWNNLLTDVRNSPT